MYSFNLHSDLHHELITQYQPPPILPTPKAQDLYFGGDLNYSYREDYKLYLHQCADIYAKQGGNVYFISGNHEVTLCYIIFLLDNKN